MQQAIYLRGFLGERPPLPLHPEALEEAAKKRMSPEAFAYVAGGASRVRRGGPHRGHGAARLAP